MNADVIKLEIKSSDRVIHRDAANLNDKKAVARMLRLLEYKGFVNLVEILKIDLKDDNWFR
jgi:hypothetical protein